MIAWIDSLLFRIGLFFQGLDNSFSETSYVEIFEPYIKDPITDIS